MAPEWPGKLDRRRSGNHGETIIVEKCRHAWKSGHERDDYSNVWPVLGLRRCSRRDI